MLCIWQVQVTSAGDARGPTSLIEQLLDILQQSNNVQTRIGLLMLLSNWTCHCSPAVNLTLGINCAKVNFYQTFQTLGRFPGTFQESFLQEIFQTFIHILISCYVVSSATNGVIPFLTGQIGSNEHDEMERLSQGLFAFLLGLLITGNDNSVTNFSQDELMNVIEKRIGCEIFLDKLSEVTKHEAYNRALKHPQVKGSRASDLVFDHTFCQFFKVTKLSQRHFVLFTLLVS